MMPEQLGAWWLLQLTGGLSLVSAFLGLVLVADA